MEKKEVMSEELALQEIERWADENDIDIYVKGQNGETMLDASIPKLIRKIQSGALVVNDENDFVYTVSDKSPSVFSSVICILPLTRVPSTFVAEIGTKSKLSAVS